MTADQAYTILGISDKNISEAELKRAFYEAARLTHPDSNPEDENAVHKFKMIKDAYSFLEEYVKTVEPVKEPEIKTVSPDHFEGTKRKTYSEYKKQYENKDSSSFRAKDAWDYYEEADRRYANEMHKSATNRAKKTMERRAEFERQERQEKLRREKLKQAQSEWEKEQLKRDTGKPFEERSRMYGAAEKSNEHASVNEEKALARKIVRDKILSELLWVEFICFFLLSVVSMVELLQVITGISHRVSRYAIRTGMLAWWILAIQLGYYITKFVSRYLKDRIVLLLVFLLSMEGVLGLYKVMGIVLKESSKGINALIIMSIAFGLQFLNIKRVKSCAESEDSFVRKSTILGMSFYAVCVLCGIIFVVLTIL